jgi:hypothetical protein
LLYYQISGTKQTSQTEITNPSEPSLPQISFSNPPEIVYPPEPKITVTSSNAAQDASSTKIINPTTQVTNYVQTVMQALIAAAAADKK